MYLLFECLFSSSHFPYLQCTSGMYDYKVLFVLFQCDKNEHVLARTSGETESEEESAAVEAE
jgi:hypothetical protein